MKYRLRDLQGGKIVSVKGEEYLIYSTLSYGRGLLASCVKFFLEPVHNKALPELCAFRWSDGEIYSLKPVKK